MAARSWFGVQSARPPSHEEERLMADKPPPDRLSNNPRSEHFDMEALQRGVGIRFNGREREDVEEYCVSEGWIRVQAGKAVDRHGLPVTVKLSGPVETWWREGEGQSDMAAHAPERGPVGHGPGERKGARGHTSEARTPQVRKKQDRG